MNKNKMVINLPLFETLKRSFLYTIFNFDLAVKVCAVWATIIIYEIFAGFPALCHLSEQGCGDKILQNISVLVLSLASIAIIIAYCRGLILKEDSKRFVFSLGRRELKYLGFSLILVALIIFPVIVLSFILKAFKVSENGSNILVIVLLINSIICSRFYLVFPAIAVDNKEIDMKKSFIITVGNANKIFWGQFFMMMPVILLMIIISTLYKIFNMDNFIVNLLFVSMFIATSFLDACFKASFYSHLYQYFMYFLKQDSKESLVVNEVK